MSNDQMNNDLTAISFGFNYHPKHFLQSFEPQIRNEDPHTFFQDADFFSLVPTQVRQSELSFVESWRIDQMRIVFWTKENKKFVGVSKFKNDRILSCWFEVKTGKLIRTIKELEDLVFDFYWIELLLTSFFGDYKESILKTRHIIATVNLNLVGSSMKACPLNDNSVNPDYVPGFLVEKSKEIELDDIKDGELTKSLLDLRDTLIEYEIYQKIDKKNAEIIGQIVSTRALQLKLAEISYRLKCEEESKMEHYSEEMTLSGGCPICSFNANQTTKTYNSVFDYKRCGFVELLENKTVVKALGESGEMLHLYSDRVREYGLQEAITMTYGLEQKHIDPWSDVELDSAEEDILLTGAE